MNDALSGLVVISLTLLAHFNVAGQSCHRVPYTDIPYLLDESYLLTHSTWHLHQPLVSELQRWPLSATSIMQQYLPIDRDQTNKIRQVKDCVFSIVSPTPYRSGSELAGYSDDVLELVLDMDPAITQTDEFLAVVSGGRLLDGPLPMAHRYGGHQFGSWAGQLGDGRAHLVAEYMNRRGERWELQLKGSGLTPYSRRGDGRAVIRSSVREFLCSEAMFHLGVPTSRAATLAVSKDVIWRDQFYNGDHRRERTAVVLRMAKSWFRFGSLEILSSEGEIDLLQTLTDFILQQHFRHISINSQHRYFQLFSEVVEQTAHLIVLWQSIGFAHGVLNTDNFSILSITIDYGPFGFLDEYNPGFVPNTSDDEARYSYENQPDVGYFNLNKLRLALDQLVSKHGRSVLKQILDGYDKMYKSKFMEVFRHKLGLPDSDPQDEYLVALLLKMMQDAKADFTMTFRQLGDWNIDLIKDGRADRSLWALEAMKTHEHFEKWTSMYYNRISSSGISQVDRKHLIHSTNPRYVLRNWIAEEIIKKVENDDFSLLRKAGRIFTNPYMEQDEAELLGFADPPPDWARNIRVSCSS